MSPVNSLIVNIYNTLTRRLEEIVPMKRGRIRLFVCGPTVFNFIHLGNARTFVLFDSLAKYLTASGYEVFYLQNITDIDDKTLKVAAQTGVPWQDVSSRFFEEYLRDMKALGVDSVNVYAKATLYMDEIRSQIRRLMNRGYAYETQDGVYFHVEKFRDMGELSGQKLDKVVPGSRVVPSEQKINPVDFVLWKKHKAGEPSWDSPWGPGRPGWHIEDTAITESFFGLPRASLRKSAACLTTSSALGEPNLPLTKSLTRSTTTMAIFSWLFPVILTYLPLSATRIILNPDSTVLKNPPYHV